MISRRAVFVFILAVGMACVAVAQISVPAEPPVTAGPQDFYDSHYGVRFQVPPGWDFAKKDHLLSSFRMDARTASKKSEVRGVANLAFNPFPLSTLSGALFYYSVEKHVNDAECARQAAPTRSKRMETQDIGGMSFVHGHDENGSICVEARDDVYTAYRKGSCYRFDLEVHTFCAVSSGAQEITDTQMESIEARMGNILGSVVLDWRHAPPKQEVPVTPPPADSTRRPVAPPVVNSQGTF